MGVLDLPCDYLTYLFTEWFLIEEVGKLDKAMTNHAIRQQFEHILSREESVFSELPNVKALKWSLLRSMKLRTLSFDFKPKDNWTLPMMKRLFQLNRKSLHHLNVYPKLWQSDLIEPNENIKTLTLYDSSYRMVEQCLSIALFLEKLTTLKLFSISGLSTNAFTTISNVCPNLNSLTVWGCDLTGVVAQNQVFNFTSLRSLTFEHVLKKRRLLRLIVKSTVALEAFTCDSCEGTAGALQELSVRSQNLKRLSVGGFDDDAFDDGDFEDCNAGDVVRLINNSPKLTEFSVQHCNIGDYDDIIASLQPIAHQLIKVSIKNSVCGFSKTLNALITNTHVIEELHVDILDMHNETPAEELLTILVNSCPLIKKLYLDCNSCTNEALIAFVHRSPQLIEIAFMTKHLNDDVIQQIEVNCKKLKKLSIYAVALTNASLACICNGFGALECLDLIFFRFFTGMPYPGDKAKQWLRQLKRSRPKLKVTVEGRDKIL